MSGRPTWNTNAEVGVGTKRQAGDAGIAEPLPQVVSDDARTVLVVDDDAPMRTLLRVVLERDVRLSVLGEAADGRAALHLIEEQDPDLVLLDLAMPELDGIGVLHALAGRARPVVVVLSADGYVDAEATVVGLGAAAYVSKAAAFDGLADILVDVAHQRSR